MTACQMEIFPNGTLACNLLCKPVWAAPCTPQPISFSTHTHTGDLAGLGWRWCHWADVKQAIPGESAQSWLQEERKDKVTLELHNSVTWWAVMWHLSLHGMRVHPPPAVKTVRILRKEVFISSSSQRLKKNQTHPVLVAEAGTVWKVIRSVTSRLWRRMK